MPISNQYANFTTRGDEADGDSEGYQRIPTDMYHRLVIQDIQESHTSKGDVCFIQTSRFVHIETPIVLKTWYLKQHDWSLVRMENMFRNLGYQNCLADLRGIEFDGFITEREYNHQGQKRIGVELKKCDLWLNPEEFKEKQAKKKGQAPLPQQQNPLPTGMPQSPSVSQDLVEDEIPF